MPSHILLQGRDVPLLFPAQNEPWRNSVSCPSCSNALHPSEGSQTAIGTCAIALGTTWIEPHWCYHPDTANCDDYAPNEPELRSRARGLRQDREAVQAGITLCWSNGMTERFVNKV